MLGSTAGSPNDELTLENYRDRMEELREEWIQYGERQANAALLKALEQVTATLEGEYSKRADWKAHGSAMMEAARAAIEKAKAS